MAMRNRYRAVVVGCGRAGTAYGASAEEPASHAQALREHSRTELVGVSDIHEGRRMTAAARWAVQSDADASRLCEHLRPDLVSVATPDETHADVAMAILRRAPPRLMFMEKPLAMTARSARSLLAEADRVGTAIAVNHTRRFAEAFRTVRADLLAGRYGRVELVRVTYGKGLIHNGTHAIDLLRFWFGEPQSGRAHDSTWGPAGDATFDVDLRFASGTRVRLEAFDERIATVFEIDLFAERVRARASRGGNEWEFWEVREGTPLPGYRSYVRTSRGSDPVFQGSVGRALRSAVDDLVGFLDGDRPLVSTGADGLAALDWIERIRDRR